MTSIFSSSSTTFYTHFPSFKKNEFLDNTFFKNCDQNTLIEILKELPDNEIRNISFDELEEKSITKLVNHLSSYQITLLNSDTIKENLKKIKPTLIPKLQDLLRHVSIERFTSSQLLELGATFFLPTELQWIDPNIIDKNFFILFFRGCYELSNYLTFHHMAKLRYDDFVGAHILSSIPLDKVEQMSGFPSEQIRKLPLSSSTIAPSLLTVSKRALLAQQDAEMCREYLQQQIAQQNARYKIEMNTLSLTELLQHRVSNFLDTQISKFNLSIFKSTDQAKAKENFRKFFASSIDASSPSVGLLDINRDLGNNSEILQELMPPEWFDKLEQMK